MNIDQLINLKAAIGFALDEWLLDQLVASGQCPKVEPGSCDSKCRECWREEFLNTVLMDYEEHQAAQTESRNGAARAAVDATDYVQFLRRAEDGS